jgi:hypothetical protein
MLVLYGQSCLHKKFILKSLTLRFVAHRITLRKGKAQLELLYDIVTDATTAEVLFANSDAVDIVL